uniref:glycosyltransferase family 2 protein n=1 Tax=Halomonas sp. TaxID=1486246 RepID=UPI00262DE545|nr:glycosyltransferase [Halomonas sp.]
MNSNEEDFQLLSGVPYDTVTASDVLYLKDAAPLKSSIDAAVMTEDGALVVVGWIYDTGKIVQGFSALKKQSKALRKKNYSVLHLEEDLDGVQVHRIERPDVTAAMKGCETYHQHGFVLVVPKFSSEYKLALILEDGRYVLLNYSMITDRSEAEEVLYRCMPSSGSQIYMGLQAGLGEDNILTNIVESLIVHNVQHVQQLSSCDQAILVEGKLLLLNGWVGSRYRDIRKITLIAEGERFDITNKLSRYQRPDLKSVFPKAAYEAIGYISAVPMRGLNPRNIEVQISWRNGEKDIRDKEVERMGWAGLHNFLQQHYNLFPSIMHQLKIACKYPNHDAIFSVRLEKMFEILFPNMVQSLPTMVEHPERSIIAIDKAFALHSAGLLAYGWMIIPNNKPQDITIHDEMGNAVSVKDSFMPLVREDVSNSYQERFPGVPRQCGFLLHASLASEPGTLRAICFHYAEQGDIWVRLSLNDSDRQGIALIKEVLGMIPSPDQLSHSLYKMFDNGLGKALEEINQQRLASNISSNNSIEVRQFGVVPEETTTSIIVPLYGRIDFMRHQLARFADDPDFRKVDLIYVVDDPSLIEAALSLAARYHWLFDIPFRVVWYDRNLGFAGANNVAAGFAKSPRLLLLNSDVIPQKPGWLSIMERELDTLPDAGAVGPLLLFGDDSIQHAGMHSRWEPQLPGFMLNTHPGMGQYWQGGSKSYEQPMLTAACLLLKKSNYDALGGFDEGYVIGDFEDSDLCLGLRTKGLRLFVVPEARLWHLERQSQTINNSLGIRQLITLFNGWRYLEKIKRGELVNPMELELDMDGQT